MRTIKRKNWCLRGRRRKIRGDREIINEWLEAGNKIEEFTEKGPKIVIILDNASFHKKLEYIQKIRDGMPNIHARVSP